MVAGTLSAEQRASKMAQVAEESRLKENDSRCPVLLPEMRGVRAWEALASALVALLREVDAFDAECFFNKGAPGRYCGVSLRRVWDDDERAEGDERSKRAEGAEGQKSAYASHYTGNG